MDRWTEADAKRWRDARPWVCGFNFLPSSAVNFIEMWHPDTFDMDGIERELGWAADIGFNALRVNLPFVGWVADRDGLLDRLDRVMGAAARLGMDTVPCLFDDCGFGGKEPVWGPQADPIPGVHNSRAVASPGRATVIAGDRMADLEAYVTDVIHSFCADPRILFWDLYNEPGNGMEFGAGANSYFSGADALRGPALALMDACFAWARAASPAQPLSVAAWTTPLPGDASHPYQTEIDRCALVQSDIVTFHAYWGRDRVARFIDYLEVLNRPIFCTEWMARAVDSKISDQLHLFHDRGVGCFQWGLVRGRTQTHLPWPADLVRAHGGSGDDTLWFHDLLHQDGRAYDDREVATIRALSQADRTPRRKESG